MFGGLDDKERQSLFSISEKLDKIIELLEKWN